MSFEVKKDAKMEVGTDHGKVIISFSEPTVWIGLSPEQARAMAALLVKHAERLEEAKP
jgi:hypothetical protein